MINFNKHLLVLLTLKVTAAEVVKTSVTTTTMQAPPVFLQTTYTTLDDQFQQTSTDTIDTEDDHH